MTNHAQPFRLVRSNGEAISPDSFTSTADAQAYVASHRDDARLQIGDHLFAVPTDKVVNGRFTGTTDENTSLAVLRVGLDGAIHIDKQ